MYRALDVANYVVSKCLDDGCPISNLQLQKILYYIQKDYLKRDNLAFSDDIEAWQFGPVVPNVYYDYCGSGALPIDMAGKGKPIAPSDRNRFDAVIEKKRILDPWAMVHDTHKPGGAWDQIYANGAGNRMVIPTSLIKTAG